VQPKNSITESISPAALVSLYAYQKRWITDDSRFKLGVKGRQEGFTFATTLRHVRRRLSKKGTTVWISASERQSKEAAEYARIHLAALREVFDVEEIEFPNTDEKAIQITFKHNGSRMIFMPANPDTVRGFSGDVVLDEFAFHRDPVKIWRAAMAIISRGHSLEVISTPNGQAGKYWDLCNAAGVDPLGAMTKRNWTKGIWSVHWVDIYASVEEGNPVDIAALREAAGDEDTWLQEFAYSLKARSMGLRIYTSTRRESIWLIPRLCTFILESMEYSATDSRQIPTAAISSSIISGRSCLQTSSPLRFRAKPTSCSTCRPIRPRPARRSRSWETIAAARCASSMRPALRPDTHSAPTARSNALT
jgi:hypothetical protein